MRFNFVNFFSARSAPFRVGVNFNNDEAVASAAVNKASSNEKNGSPGGIVGFKLYFAQIWKCKTVEKFLRHAQ